MAMYLTNEVMANGQYIQPFKVVNMVRNHHFNIFIFGSKKGKHVIFGSFNVSFDISTNNLGQERKAQINQVDIKSVQWLWIITAIPYPKSPTSTLSSLLFFCLGCIHCLSIYKFHSFRASYIYLHNSQI